MKKFKRRRQVSSDLCSFSFGKPASLLNPSQQLSSFNFLKNQIKPTIIFEHFQKLYYVRMTLAMVESFHFTENSCPRMTRYFVNHFHSELHVCQYVHTRLDGRISAPTEYFATQPVQVCET